MESTTKAIGTNSLSSNYFALPKLVNLKSFDNFRVVFPKEHNEDNRNFPFEEIDDRGYVKRIGSITLDNGEVRELDTTMTSVRIDRSLGIENYVFSYLGDAEKIKIKNADAIKTYTLPTHKDGQTTVNVIEVKFDLTVPSNERIKIFITGINPDNHVRDIELKPIGLVGTFSPNFVRTNGEFNHFRFMDIMETNNSGQSEWKDRPKLDDFTYFKKGYPVELMIQYCNETNTNPWFNIPHLATDEYIYGFATSVCNKLNNNLVARIEFSNELWNWGFMHSKEENAKAQSEGKKWFERYCDNVIRMANIWADAFKYSDRNRYKIVLGTKGGSVDNFTRKKLEYLKEGGNLHLIDDIAINSYFGSRIGHRDNEQLLLELANDEVNGLNRLFEMIDESLEQMIATRITPLLELLAEPEYQEHGLKIATYEGGQHLTTRGLNDKESINTIGELFMRANRDERMGDCYKKLVSEWFRLCGDDAVFCHFTDVKDYTVNDCYGLIEEYGQDSPKKRGLWEGILEEMPLSTMELADTIVNE